MASTTLLHMEYRCTKRVFLLAWRVVVSDIVASTLTLEEDRASGRVSHGFVDVCVHSFPGQNVTKR